jgi:hypothetical protein
MDGCMRSSHPSITRHVLAKEGDRKRATEKFCINLVDQLKSQVYYDHVAHMLWVVIFGVSMP